MNQTFNPQQKRTPRGIPGAGEFAAQNRPDSTSAPLTLAPSPAAVAAFAKRQPLATAPKPEPLPVPKPNYTVELAELPKRDVNLGRGIDLDLFAGQYADLDVWSYDEDGEVVDFDPATADSLALGEFKNILSNGYPTK